MFNDLFTLSIVNITIIIMLQCNTIREFDTAYTIKMFNYTNVYHYYEDASLSNKLHLINVPCLCLSAADDPFLYFRGTHTCRVPVFGAMDSLSRP